LLGVQRYLAERDEPRNAGFTAIEAGEVLLPFRGYLRAEGGCGHIAPRSITEGQWRLKGADSGRVEDAKASLELKAEVTVTVK
jgi:hypothetical protein